MPWYLPSGPLSHHLYRVLPLRLILPLAAAYQRAGVVAGIYIVSYIAFGVPIIIAGQLAGPLGLVPTVFWYSAVTVLLALISLGAQLINRMKSAQILKGT